ncbi:MAG: tetratricopeptide repeat-containing sensor histidine kinase, partial [Bacteroidota bacterium]
MRPIIASGQLIDEVIARADTIDNPHRSLHFLRPYQNEIAFASDSIQARYFYLLGIAHGKLYQTDSAKYAFNKAFEKARISSAELIQIGALNGLANVARSTSNNDVAQDYFERALDMASQGETNKHKGWESKLLGNLAGIFYDVGNYESALDYTQRGLDIARDIGDSISLATNLIRAGYCFSAMQLPVRALEVNQEAVKIFENAADSLNLIYQYYNVASIYAGLQNYPQAKENYGKAIDLAARYGEAETHAASLNALAALAIEEGQFGSADQMVNEAIELAKANGILVSQKTSYQLAYQLDRQRGSYASAIDNLQLYHAIKDSIQKTATIQSIEDFRVKYETAEKEKQIVELEAQASVQTLEAQAQQRLSVVMLILLVLLLLIVLLVYSRYMQNRRANALLQERNTALEKLNDTKSMLFAIVSHDIRSPLVAFSSIANTILQNLESIDEGKLRKYLKKLVVSSSHLNNLVLNLVSWSRSQLDHLDTEVQYYELIDVIDESVTSLKDLIEEHGIEVHCKLDHQPSVLVDKELLKTGIRNILANSIKFTPQGGKINIRSYREDDQLKLA